MVVRRTSRRMLTMDAAMTRTGYPATLLREAVKRGELPAERPAGGKFGRLFFDRVELDRWVERVRVNPKRETA